MASFVALAFLVWCCGVVVLFCIPAEVEYIPWAVVVVFMSVNLVLVTVIGVVGGRLSG